MAVTFIIIIINHYTFSSSLYIIESLQCFGHYGLIKGNQAQPFILKEFIALWENYKISLNW